MLHKSQEVGVYMILHKQYNLNNKPGARRNFRREGGGGKPNKLPPPYRQKHPPRGDKSSKIGSHIEKKSPHIDFIFSMENDRVPSLASPPAGAHGSMGLPFLSYIVFETYARARES